MKIILAVAMAAGLAALTACSASTPVPDSSGRQEPGRSDQPPETAGTTSPAIGGAKAACERFNSLFTDYAAVPSDDPQGYEDVYVQAEEAKDTVTGDLQGLFASLRLLAIDHSSAAEAGGEPARESKDALRDAVFANSGTCTAEGVTLRL